MDNPDPASQSNKKPVSQSDKAVSTTNIKDRKANPESGNSNSVSSLSDVEIHDANLRTEYDDSVGDAVIQVSDSIVDSFAENDLYQTTLPDGTVIHLQGVSPTSLVDMMYRKEGMPQAPWILEGKGKPIPPMVKDGDEYVEDLTDAAYREALAQWEKNPRVRKKRRRNEDDPVYKFALNEWEQQKNVDLLKFLVVEGVISDPPEDELDGMMFYLGDNASQNQLRYMWVSNKLRDFEEMSEFMNKLIGITFPDSEGDTDSDGTPE